MIVLLFGALLAVANPAGQRVVGTRIETFRAIIRVPRQAEEAQPRRWREVRGPSCVDARRIAAAKVRSDTALDLVMTDGRRLRAELERRCPVAEFDHGFYLRPGRDGTVCADRSTIRARSGRQCEIRRFHMLTPERESRRRDR